MEYPNVAVGIKRLYNSQLFILISTILITINTPLIIFAFEDSGASLSLSRLLLVLLGILMIIVSTILFFISYITNISGVIRSSKDEKAFLLSLFWIIITSLAGLSSVFFDRGSTGAHLASIIIAVGELFATSNIIRVIDRIANRKYALEVSNYAFSSLHLLYITYSTTILLQIIAFSVRFLNSETAVILLEMLSKAGLFICGILKLLSYAIYLRFLGKAKTLFIVSKNTGDGCASAS